MSSTCYRSNFCSMNCCNYYGSCPDNYQYNTNWKYYQCYKYYTSSTPYSSSSSSSSYSTSSYTYSTGSNGGTIGGAVGGAIAGVIILIIIIVCCIKKRQQAALQEQLRMANLNKANNNGTTLVITQPMDPGYGQPYAANPAYYGQPAYGQPAFPQPQLAMGQPGYAGGYGGPMGQQPILITN